MACRVISLAWGEGVVTTRQARAPGQPPPVPGPLHTHQQHGLFADEGLLQSQRGGIQAWDWGSRSEGAIPRHGR